MVLFTVAMVAGLFTPGTFGMASDVCFRFEPSLGLSHHFHVPQRSSPNETTLQETKTIISSQHSRKRHTRGEDDDGDDDDGDDGDDVERC